MLKDLYNKTLEDELILVKKDLDYTLVLVTELSAFRDNPKSKIQELSRYTLEEWEPEVAKLTERLGHMQDAFSERLSTRERYEIRYDISRYYVFDRVFQEPIFRGTSKACRELIDGLEILQEGESK